MATAIDVARCLIHLAAREEEPDTLSPLRLQKLLYYVQGWSLALKNKPMFSNRIEAWVHGPVVPDVYRIFSDYGFQPIPAEAVKEPKGLTESEREFIKAVWDAYKDYAPMSLRRMTHKESPWIEARKGYEPGELCTEEITKNSMKKYFKSIAK